MFSFLFGIILGDLHNIVVGQSLVAKPKQICFAFLCFALFLYPVIFKDFSTVLMGKSLYQMPKSN